MTAPPQPAQPGNRPDLAAAAQSIADLAIAELNQHRTPGTDAFAPHDPTWTRIATASYRLLRQHAEKPTQSPMAPRCQADPQRIRAWLARPWVEDGFETTTNAEHWDLHDFDQDSGAHVETLVAEAQAGGVFGVPDHQVLAWYLPGEHADNDGYLITVDTPTGQRLCSSWLAYHTVMPTDRTGVDAVVDVLTGLTAAVDEALTGTPSPHTDHATTQTGQLAQQPPAARAFPPPADTAAPAAPAPPPTPHPGRPGRHTGPHR